MLTPKTGRRRQIETAQDSGGFPRSTWARDPAPSSAQPSSSCSSPGTLLGRGCQGWERQGHTHLEGTEPLTNRPSGFLLQQLETHPRPNAVMLATVQRSPSSGLALALAPPPPTKLMAASTAREKTGLMLTSDSALPLGTHVKQIGTVLHEDQTGNCFT